MSSRRSSCAARSFVLRGALGCFLLATAESAPCTSSSAVQVTVDSAQTASSAIETVSCTGGVFSVEWVGNITLPRVFNISGGTVLSIFGGSGEDVIDGARVTQLFFVSDAELNLEGVTLMGGFIEPSDQYTGFRSSDEVFVYSDEGVIEAAPSGGAISASNSIVTMTNCVAAGNVAENGGAVFLKESHLGIFGVTAFTINEADSSGGAIFAIANSTVTVEGEANFSSNSGSDDEDAAGGGAIRFSESSNVTVLGKATFHGNSGGTGGAVTWEIDSFFNITGEAEFSNNAAYAGGAILNNGEDGVTSLNLDGRVIFFNNTAVRNGGALGVLRGDVSIGGEVNFTENSAGGEGGAISSSTAGWLTFEDNAVVRFTTNQCGGSGGGIALFGSAGLSGRGVDNVSFVDNFAGDSGGAIYANTVSSFSLDGRFLFVGNGAVNSGGAVHVIVASDFDLTYGVEFRGNFARIGGAVVVESSGGGTSTSSGSLRRDYASIDGCRFFANVAGEDGGALHVGSGFTSVADSVFEGNTAGEGANKN